MKVAILTTDSREHFKEYEKPAPYFGTAPEALLQGLANLAGVEVHVISCMRQPVATPVQLEANIRYHALLVPKRGWMSTLYQGCIRAVRRKLREIQPDLVHGQGTERECAISAVFSGLPNVLTIHGNMGLIAQVTRARPFSYPWLAGKLERVTLPRTDGIVCITQYTRAAVAAQARRTWVVPNGVDQRFFGISSGRGGSAVPLLLVVGKVCVRKNQNAFIRALDPLAARTRFRLVFAGDATAAVPYEAEFLEMVRARPWCQHVGFTDRETLKNYLRDAALLALPSLEDNCPMVVLEAMAAGVPVLAANVGGLPDLIEDGRNGLFCNPLEAASMAAGVARLLESPALGQQLAAEAKQRATARFHPRIIAERHVEIYREVLRMRS